MPKQEAGVNLSLQDALQLNLCSPLRSNVSSDARQTKEDDSTALLHQE